MTGNPPRQPLNPDPPEPSGGASALARARWELLRKWIKGKPVWVFAGITLGCLVFKDNYPFTHNPMYANLPPRVRYYYVVDENGANVPFRDAFGYSLIDLMRKIKDRRKSLAREDDADGVDEAEVLAYEKEALEPVMAWYFDNRRARGEFKGKPIPYQTLTVIKVLSTREGKKETPLGTVPVPGEEVAP
ncbi:MAG: hypothetical protein R3F11_02420 [Verrucomicrobiales bacterium]